MSSSDRPIANAPSRQRRLAGADVLFILPVASMLLPFLTVSVSAFLAAEAAFWLLVIALVAWISR